MSRVCFLAFLPHPVPEAVGDIAVDAAETYVRLAGSSGVRVITWKFPARVPADGVAFCGEA